MQPFRLSTATTTTRTTKQPFTHAVHRLHSVECHRQQHSISSRNHDCSCHNIHAARIAPSSAPTDINPPSPRRHTAHLACPPPPRDSGPPFGPLSYLGAPAMSQHSHPSMPQGKPPGTDRGQPAHVPPSSHHSLTLVPSVQTPPQLRQPLESLQNDDFSPNGSQHHFSTPPSQVFFPTQPPSQTFFPTQPPSQTLFPTQPPIQSQRPSLTPTDSQLPLSLPNSQTFFPTQPPSQPTQPPSPYSSPHCAALPDRTNSPTPGSDGDPAYVHVMLSLLARRQVEAVTAQRRRLRNRKARLAWRGRGEKHIDLSNGLEHAIMLSELIPPGLRVDQNVDDVNAGDTDTGALPPVYLPGGRGTNPPCQRFLTLADETAEQHASPLLKLQHGTHDARLFLHSYKRQYLSP